MFLARFAAAALLFACSGVAQVSTARLEGTVQDSTGAVIPGAQVQALNLKTQIAADAKADAEGRFVFASLAPSDYTLTVESTGFRKSVVSALKLGVAETVTQTVVLEVGAVTDSVSVEANAIRVQVSDAQIAKAVLLADIQTLPQLGRGPINIAVFSPGVQIDPSDTTYSRINGARQGSNNTLLDGIEANDPVAPRFGLVMVGTSTDNVEEIRVITNGGKAEYGRNAGGQVQMVTRSGTNAFHGAGWDYLRNTNLNANNFFNNRVGTARPKYIRNIFGGNFAGPVLKNRTFFFGNYEGTRTRQQVVRNRTVLTPEAKGGIFRWRTTASSPIQSFDIVSNDPRGKGIDPAVKKLLGMTPDPNNYDVGDLLNTAGFSFNAPANAMNDQLTIKVDHDLWRGNRIFYRHSWMRTYSIDTTNSAEARYPGQEDGKQGGHRAGYAFGSDWVINPSTVNELRVGGQLSNSDFLRPRLHEAMLVPNLYTSPIAGPTDFAQGRRVPYKELTDSLSKIRGNHTIKTGANIRITDQYSWREDYAWPAVNLARTFGNIVSSTIGPQTPSITSTDRTRFENLYNDLLGRPSDVLQRYYSDLVTYQPAGTGRQRNFNYKEFGLFLQDDWKLSRRFTLNVGLRYEWFGVPTERDGLQGYLDKQDQLNQVNRITDFMVTKGAPYYKDDWNNFGPRLSFAWDVFGDGKTALRGGSGIFYERMINSTLTAPDGIPGFQTDVRPQPNQAAGADVRVSDGMPPLAPPASVSLTIPLDRNTSVTQMDPNMRTGYVLHTNLTLQREILRNTVLEVGYVGTHGVKLFMHNNLNQSRIYEDFLTAFNQVKAYRDSKTPVPATNTLVRLFGSPDAAITALSASNFDNGAVGAVANTLDNTASNYNRYAAAGVPITYLRNFPQFSTMYLGTNDGRSYYNSVQASFRRNTGALRFTANYTLSKSVDNWANEGNGTDSTSVIDWFNTRLNRGRSDFDKTHSFNSQATYTLPIGKGHRYLGAAPRWVDSLIGGWDVGVLNVWQSGSVFSVSSGRATGPGTANTWADISGDRNIGQIDKADGVSLFTADDLARFTYPQAGTIGTSGRNAFRGPRYFNMDATLSKRFRITESAGATLRLEAYNVFNNASFGTPAASMATMTSLGKYSSTTGSARVAQVAARFDF